MSTFEVVKNYEGKWMVVSSKGTSVTGLRFRTPSEAEKWVARNYENVTVVRQRGSR